MFDLASTGGWSSFCAHSTVQYNAAVPYITTCIPYVTIEVSTITDERSNVSPNFYDRPQRDSYTPYHSTITIRLRPRYQYHAIHPPFPSRRYTYSQQEQSVEIDGARSRKDGILDVPLSSELSAHFGEEVAEIELGYFLREELLNGLNEYQSDRTTR